MKIIYTQPSISNVLLDSILIFRYTIPYGEGKIFISSADITCIELWTDGITLPWTPPGYFILKNLTSC